jgi:hypothetical protein
MREVGTASLCVSALNSFCFFNICCPGKPCDPGVPGVSAPIPIGDLVLTSKNIKTMIYAKMHEPVYCLQKKRFLLNAKISQVTV